MVWPYLIIAAADNDDYIPIHRLVLDVCQQPERARLCSFKEENETSEHPPSQITNLLLVRLLTHSTPQLIVGLWIHHR